MYTPIDPEYELTQAEMKTHYEQHKGMHDRPLSYFEPAYFFGAMLATQNLPTNSVWANVESQARQRWEQGADNGPWEEVVDAVRHGWNSLKARLFDAGDNDGDA